jgi:hypothetical protein
MGMGRKTGLGPLEVIFGGTDLETFEVLLCGCVDDCVDRVLRRCGLDDLMGGAERRRDSWMVDMLGVFLTELEEGGHLSFWGEGVKE